MAGYGSPDYQTLLRSSQRPRLLGDRPTADPEQRRALQAGQLRPPDDAGLRGRLRAQLLGGAPGSVGAPGSGSVQASSEVTETPPARDPSRGRKASESEAGAGPPSGDDSFENFLRLVRSRYTGKGTSPNAIRRAMLQLQAGLSYQYLPQLQGAIGDLQAQSDPTKLATTYARDFEHVNDQYDVAEGRLDRALAERGLTDSSYGAAAFGALSSGRAQAVSGLENQIEQEARGRGDMARQLLLSLVTGNMQGATDLVSRIRQEKLARAQMQGGSWLDDLLQVGVAGTQIAKNV